MTIEIALVLLILLAALVLFVTEWLRMDLVALLGALMTLIGTPPNLLVSMFMEDSGMLLLGVAIAASASLASPVAHPANVLVMGPGGYRFVDYLKLGLPLTLVVFGVTRLLLPWVWPLQ